MSSASSVAIIVDADFGDRLEEIAARMPVWIVETPANREIAETNSTAANNAHPNGVTTFHVDRSAQPEDWVIAVLASVDLHHGDYSQDPAYDVVEVFGTSLTPTVQRAFEEFAFTTFSDTADGFVALRTVPAGT